MIAGTYILSGVLLGVAGFMLGDLDGGHADHLRRGDLLLRLGRRQRGVPHRQRGLPDGDPGPVHRVLLRDRHGRGGIAGPLLFGKLIDNASASKDITQIAIGYFIGAALMIAGGIVEVFLGVKAEGQRWRDIAKPLTAEDADTGTVRHRPTPCRRTPDEEEPPCRCHPRSRPPRAPATARCFARDRPDRPGAAHRGPAAAPSRCPRLVGASYWEPGRFERALAFASPTAWSSAPPTAGTPRPEARRRTTQKAARPGRSRPGRAALSWRRIGECGSAAGDRAEHGRGPGRQRQHAVGQARALRLPRQHHRRRRVAGADGHCALRSPRFTTVR